MRGRPCLPCASTRCSRNWPSWWNSACTLILNAARRQQAKGGRGAKLQPPQMPLGGGAVQGPPGLMDPRRPTSCETSEPEPVPDGWEPAAARPGVARGTCLPGGGGAKSNRTAVAPKQAKAAGKTKGAKAPASARSPPWGPAILACRAPHRVYAGPVPAVGRGRRALNQRAVGRAGVQTDPRQLRAVAPSLAHNAWPN
jgi:hypothetical protein